MKFMYATFILSSGLVFVTASGQVGASGFALIEQSGSGTGNAYAGGAASAEDASTIFFNPAGMSRLQGKQVVVAAHAIKPSAKFSDTGSSAATTGSRPLGTTPDDAGGWAYIPNGYFAMDINPQTKFGLGVNVPFGLKTEYQPGWIGRFQALKSSVETININPSAAYQVNDILSIGAGLNYQTVKAELTSARNLGASEGLTTMTGDDAAWGFNLGALYQMDQGGRVGIAYRSPIKYKLEGSVVVTSAAGATLLNTPVTADLKMPETLSFSYFRMMDKWDVMADLSRTGWNSFQELRIIQTSSGSALQVTPENWRNTWRAALGANYHYNEQWTSRIGLAYDQSPVPDEFRTARIPDNDRTWLSFGGQYKPSKTSAVDFGYAHLFIKKSTISNNTGATGTADAATVGNLVGTYKNNVHILSAQYTHSF